MMNTFAGMSHNGIAITISQVHLFWMRLDKELFAWKNVRYQSSLWLKCHKLFQILLGLLSFLTIAFGGLIIGIVYGLLTALVTRTTTDGTYSLETSSCKNIILKDFYNLCKIVSRIFLLVVRVCEPLAIFGIAYLSYATAELLHWSGIISLIGCGIVQAHYAFKNISKKSYTTVKYFIKMLRLVLLKFMKLK